MNWEQSYLEENVPWDLGEPAPPLVSLLENDELSLQASSTVLVPGCGYGHDAEAWQASGFEVTGLDLSSTALKFAQKLYGNSVRWVEGNFLDPSLVLEHSADLIFEHTCFCAIDPEQRRSYVQSTKQWLVPGGVFLGLFYMDPPSRDDGEPGPPFGTSLDELRALFGEAFTITRERSPDHSHPDRLGCEMLIEMVRNP